MVLVVLVLFVDGGGDADDDISELVPIIDRRKQNVERPIFVGPVFFTGQRNASK